MTGQLVDPKDRVPEDVCATVLDMINKARDALSIRRLAALPKGYPRSDSENPIALGLRRRADDNILISRELCSFGSPDMFARIQKAWGLNLEALD
jgi:hypothetical protein